MGTNVTMLLVGRSHNSKTHHASPPQPNERVTWTPGSCPSGARGSVARGGFGAYACGKRFRHSSLASTRECSLKFQAGSFPLESFLERWACQGCLLVRWVRELGGVSSRQCPSQIPRRGRSPTGTQVSRSRPMVLTRPQEESDEGIRPICPLP